MPITLNNGFSLTISDPNNILGANQAALVTDMNYVVGLLSTYINFKQPLDLQINLAPASANPNNTDGLMPSAPAWVNYNGATTLAAIVKGTTGVDPNGTTADAGFTFYAGNDGTLKNYGSPFWFDPNPTMGVTPTLPAGSTDFIGVAIHELLHCFGFASWPAANAPWNQHTVQIGGNWYYSSPAVNALLGGPLPLAPNTSGTANDHIGNTALTYQPVTSDLMFQYGYYSANRLDIGQLDLLILRDLGWDIKNYTSLPLVDPRDSFNKSGTPGNDTIAASAISSTISAGDGNDVINLPTTAGNGNYLLDGGNGNDTVVVGKAYTGFNLVANATDFIMQSIAGTDGASLLRSIETVQFTDAKITIVSGHSGVSILGLAANTALHGTAGDDIFLTGGGSAAITGGSGLDTVDYSSGAPNGIAATVIGGNGTVAKSGIGTDTLNSIEAITGSTGADVFTVDAAMSVNGGGGFDYLIEASAAVNLTYGTNFTNISEFVTNVGTNTINASTDTNSILIYGSTGTDILSLGTGGGYLFSGGGNGNVLNGGSAGVNILIDSGGTSTMNGGGGSSNNYFYVNGTNDVVHGAGAFNAVVYLSTDAAYSTIATDGVQEVIFNGGTNVGNGTGATSFLYLYGGSGNDTLTTGTAGGYLIGGGGTNTLTGGGGVNVFIADNAAGIDHMFGGSSSNIYYIDGTSDVHGAGAFNTVIELQQSVALTLGSAQLGSNVQQIILNAGTNSANFSSATSTVYLYGGAGADTLKGGTGNDYLYGGAGANTFQFGASWGNDVVTDWTSGSGNVLDLTALSGSGVHAMTDITQSIQSLTVNGNSVLSDVITSTHTGTNSIVLWGVASALGSGSFHFA